MRVNELPFYELADAADAAGIPAERLSAWVLRGNISPAQRASGSGGRHKFSRDNVITIAIAARLWDFGLDPSDAFGLAAAWTEDTNQNRAPGELFPTGRTLLVADGDRLPRIVNADAAPPVHDRATVTIDLNAVVASVEPNLIERWFTPLAMKTLNA